MPKLFRETTFLAELIPAQRFKQRLLGLIPYSSLSEKEIFWIPACSSVHTFFMKFPIDVVFTNSQFKITALFEKVGARKILFGGFKSKNVFEMKAGQIEIHQLKKGDCLHVES